MSSNPGFYCGPRAHPHCATTTQDYCCSLLLITVDRIKKKCNKLYNQSAIVYNDVVASFPPPNQWTHLPHDSEIAGEKRRQENNNQSKSAKKNR